MNPVVGFDAERHEYQVDGVIRPSVTQILKGAGFIQDDWYSDAARNRGSAVHAACHYLDENDLAMDTLAPEYAGYVEAWELFKNQADVEIELRESRVYHPLYGYAGTLDRTLRLRKHPRRWVVDIKTGQEEDWHALQTAAYAGTFENGGALCRMAVYLRKDGTFTTREFMPSDFRVDFMDFLAAVRVDSRKVKANGSRRRTTQQAA